MNKRERKRESGAKQEYPLVVIIKVKCFSQNDDDIKMNGTRFREKNSSVSSDIHNNNTTNRTLSLHLNYLDHHMMRCGGREKGKNNIARNVRIG